MAEPISVGRGPAASSFESVLAKLRQKKKEISPDHIERLDRSTPSYPLSFGQQRLWFLEQLQPGTATYNVAAAVHLQGLLDLPALVRALGAVVERHETLRTTFLLSDGEVVQRIGPPPPFRLPLIDLRALPRPQAHVQEVVSELARRPFDFGSEPMLRATLVALGPDNHALSFCVHHIVTDAWSMGLLVRDVAKLYESFAGGPPHGLPELPIQYVDYASWQRRWLQGQQLSKHLDYWREQLADSQSMLELPADRPRSAVRSPRGSRVFLAVSRELTEALRAASRREDVTLFTLLLAAFQILLHRSAGQNDIVIGIPIANRRRNEIANLIGFFVNTLALRSSTAGDPSLATFLARTKSSSLDAFEHQDLPLERVVEELRPERTLSYSPLFQVIFAFQNIPVAGLKLRHLEFTPMPVDRGSAMFDVTFNLAELQGGLGGWLEYSCDLFDHTTVARLAEHFKRLLAGMAVDTAVPVSRLPLLTAEEKQQIAVEWNDTSGELPIAAALHHLFELQADRAPDAIALTFADEALSYAELDARANRLARHLRALGVKTDGLVGICAERSLEMIVGLLAILKAGGAYVPLAPDHPRERLAYVLANARVSVLLTQRRLADRLPVEGLPTLLLDEAGAELAASPAGRPDVPIDPANLVYAIYTSGSTGRPKGVMNSHGAVINRLVWLQKLHPLDATAAVLQKTPFSFDVSVWEIFWPLIAGARLVMAVPGGHQDPDYLTATIAREQITNLHFVPSMLHAFLAARGLEGCRSLRRVIASGEALSAELAAGFFARFPSVELHNLYGPTEAAIEVTSWTCEPGAKGRDVPIGFPIANLRMYVLDRAAAPVPIGTVGELFIGGVGLARGYVGRPDLTAESFVPDPLATEPGARMYRTGDLGRYRADGAIEYQGRIDHQVKIRGFRIELGEIEATLETHPEVREAVVLARTDTPGDPRLVAYVVPSEGAVPTAELAQHLAAALPPYMVPASFVLLDTLPLNPNGKVDRSALPAPLALASRERDFVAPRTPVEELLCEIWADVLGLPQVGIHDNFFALGGHSLLAPRTVSRLRQAFGMEVPLRALFNRPTVAGLAEVVAEARGRRTAEEPPLVRTAHPGAAQPLSLAQLRFWARRGEGGGAANISAAARLSGPLNVAALERSLDEIVRRHEVLRASFMLVDGEPVQVVGRDLRAVFGQIDLSLLPAGRREEEARRLGVLEAAYPFDLGRAPLLRATLLRLAEREHALLLVQHHIVTDGWSEGLLAEELQALYSAFVRGEPSPLPAPPIQYADFASWQRQVLHGPFFDGLLSFWRERLRDFRVLTIPTDCPRPADRSVRGNRSKRILDTELSRSVRDLARRENASLFMTLLAAWKSFLYCWTGQEDVTLTTNIANRNRVETEGLIGLFTNVLALRNNLGGDPTFGELLGRVRESTLEAFAHQDLAFVEVLRILHPEPVKASTYNDLFPVGFVLQNFPMRPVSLPDIQVQLFGISGGAAPRDLILLVVEEGAELKLVLLYRVDIFKAATIETLLDQFVILLKEVVQDPEIRLSALAALPVTHMRPRKAATQDCIVTSCMDMTVAETLAAIGELPSPVARTCHVGNLTANNYGWIAMSPNSYLSPMDHTLYGVDDINLPWVVLEDRGVISACYNHRGELLPEKTGLHARVLHHSVPRKYCALFSYGIFAEYGGEDLIYRHYRLAAELARNLNSSKTFSRSAELFAAKPLFARVIRSFHRRKRLDILFNKWVKTSRDGYVVRLHVKSIEYSGMEDITIYTTDSACSFAGSIGELVDTFFASLEQVGRRLTTGGRLPTLRYPWIGVTFNFVLNAVKEYALDPQQKIFWHASAATNHLYVNEDRFQLEFAALVRDLKRDGYLPADADLRIIPTHSCQLFALSSEAVPILEDLVACWRECLRRNPERTRRYLAAFQKSSTPGKVVDGFFAELEPIFLQHLSECLIKFNAADRNRLPVAYLAEPPHPAYNKFGISQSSLRDHRPLFPAGLMAMRWGEADLLVKMLARLVMEQPE